jgi:Spx/MgsR family transcriptional regulator
MENVLVYGLKNCSTCRKALSWLAGHGVAHSFVDYRDTPVDEPTLKQWADAVGGWDKLINRASTSWRSLPADARLAQIDQQWLALVAQSPTLVRRPVLVLPDGQVYTGFSDKKYTDLFE